MNGLGDKIMDVRLVAPKYTSIHSYAAFILITPKQLFLYYGKYSNLLERSKVIFLFGISFTDQYSETIY